LTTYSTVLRTDANNQKDDGDETDTKLFFPTRWVPAEDSDDDARREDSASKQETETDRAQRDELIALIKQTSGFSVDKSRLQFESLKDVHPFRDPLKTVRFVSLLRFHAAHSLCSALDLMPSRFSALHCAKTCPIVLCAIENLRATPTASFHKSCMLVNPVFRDKELARCEELHRDVGRAACAASFYF
jgi:hypothetical protein